MYYVVREMSRLFHSAWIVVALFASCCICGIWRHLLCTVACDGVIFLQIATVDFNVSGGKARPRKMTIPVPGKSKKKKGKAAHDD